MSSEKYCHKSTSFYLIWCKCWLRIAVKELWCAFILEGYNWNDVLLPNCWAITVWGGGGGGEITRIYDELPSHLNPTLTTPPLPSNPGIAIS